MPSAYSPLQRTPSSRCQYILLLYVLYCMTRRVTCEYCYFSLDRQMQRSKLAHLIPPPQHWRGLVTHLPPLTLAPPPFALIAHVSSLPSINGMFSLTAFQKTLISNPGMIPYFKMPPPTMLYLLSYTTWMVPVAFWTTLVKSR